MKKRLENTVKRKASKDFAEGRTEMPYQNLGNWPLCAKLKFVDIFTFC